MKKVKTNKKTKKNKKIFKIVIFSLFAVVILLLLQHLFLKLTKKEVTLENVDKGMIVKYTIVDKDESKGYSTIDDIIKYVPDSIIYNSYGFETLVKASDSTYEGTLSNANDMLVNGVIDYAFAKRDTYGNVITDATYDPKTKKITVPKKYVEEESIQMQVLVKLSSDKIVNTKINTEITNGSTKEKIVTLNGFDSETYITLEDYDSKSSITKDEISVYINGKYEVTSDGLEYDQRAKKLTFGLNPLLANDIKVVINKKSIINNIIGSVFADDETGNAVTDDDVDSIKLSGAPSSDFDQGDTGTFTVRYAYNFTGGYPTESTTGNSYSYLNTKSADDEKNGNYVSPEECGGVSTGFKYCPERAVVYKVIQNKQYVMGWPNATELENSTYQNLSANPNSDTFVTSHEGDTDFAFRLDGNFFGTDIKIDNESRNSKYVSNAIWVSGYCLHIKANGVDYTNNYDANSKTIKLKYKVLYRNDTNNVMIMQILMVDSDTTRTVFGQAAYGVYKFNWEDGEAHIQVEKKFYDGNTDDSSSISDKSGITFKLYSSKKNCNNDSDSKQTLTTDSAGKVTFTGLKVQNTYYIKETSLGTNFSSNEWTMDSSCTKVRVKKTDPTGTDTSTNTTFYLKKINKTNRKKYYCLKIKKVDRTDTSKVLQGINFSLTYDKTTIPATTGSDGIATFSMLPYESTYSIKETSAEKVIPTNQTIYYWNANASETSESLGTLSTSLMTYNSTTKQYSCPSSPKEITKTDPPVYYCLKVKKVDAADNTAISGVTFAITLNGSESTAVTDNSGIATFMLGTSYNNGSYVVTEKAAPEGYSLPSPNYKTVNVTTMPMNTTVAESTQISKCNASADSYVFEDTKLLLNWYKETESNAKASGAKFRVQKTVGSTTYYVQVTNSKANQTDAGNPATTKYCYVYSGTTTNVNDASILESDSNGEVCISGISDKIGDTTVTDYTVVETQPAAYHTFGTVNSKSINISTTFDTSKDSNKFINYDTEFEFTKNVTSGDEKDKKIVVNGVEKTLYDLTTEELKLIEFNVYDSNNQKLTFIKSSDGVYEYSGNTIDIPSSINNLTAISDLYLNDSRKITIKHLPVGTYTIKEAKGTSCDSNSSSCVGYYYPSYTNTSDYTFVINTCSSANAISCGTGNYGIVRSSLDNTPTEITFTKKDYYKYYDQADVNEHELAEFENEKERSDFDRIVFKLKDSSGNYLTLKHVEDVGDCTSDSSYSVYRYVRLDQTLTGSNSNDGTELHACGGHIKITNLCRGKDYTMEEISVPDDSVYVKENTESTPTSVEYKIPCTSGDTTHNSTTNIINDKPTRVRFEKRDSKYNYLIPDETTTFEVYKCAKDTKCNPSDYKTVEEREKAGMTLVKFNKRAVISGDEEDSKDLEDIAGVEVYRKISDSDVSKGQEYVTDLHPYKGILVLRYLESGYNYVLLETVAPKNYSLPAGRGAETSFTVTNTTVSVDEVDVANKPTSLIIKKYADDDTTLLAGAEFKIYEGTKCDKSLSAMNQPKKLLKLKTIRDGVYENRPNADTDTIKTCEDKKGALCSDIETELTYEKYKNTFADFNTSLNEENEKVSIVQGEALVQYLEYGHCYIIEEVKAPKGYSLPEKDEDRFTMVTIEENTTYVADTYKTFINKPTPFTFYKFDEYNQLLDGAEFKLQKLNDEKKYKDLTVTKEETEAGVFYKVDSTTDNKTITTVNGSATVYYLEEGQYRIVETKPAEGKELNKNPNIATFFVDENGKVYGNSIIVNKAKTEKIELKSSASAELVVVVRTGVTVVRYGLIIVGITGTIIALMALIRIKKNTSR